MLSLPRAKGTEDALEELCRQVDGDRLIAFTKGVSQEVRLSGSDEEKRAFRWLAGRLQEFGANVRLTEHPGYVSWPGPASLEVSGLGSLPCITHAMARPTGGLQAEILDLGAMAPEAVAKVDAAGSIVLLDGVANPARVQAAEAAGASGEIFVSGQERHEMIVSPVWGSPGAADLARLPRTPSVSIDRATARHLRSHLALGPAVATIRTEVETRWRQLPLLEAEIVPTNGAQDFILFSGHVDSWHLGAMDNGSANAVMLEMVRLFAPLRGEFQRGLRVCFWSGHSHGRYAGSSHYADEHFFELRDHCVVHVNVDSPGGQGATDLSHAITSSELWRLGRDSVEAESDVPYIGTPPLRAGDESFLAMGVPALFMEVSEQPPGGEGGSGVSAGGGLGWWWHTPEDTIDKLDPVFLARDARIYLRALHRLLTRPVLPMQAAAAATEVLQELEAAAGAARGRLDLALPIGLARRLQRRAEAVDALAERLGGASEPQAALVRRVNRRLMGLGRALGQVRYAQVGPTVQDPALAQGLLPGLGRVAELAACPEGAPLIAHLQVDLGRERNRIALALMEALNALR